MTTAHSVLTGSDLHEVKGASSASADTVMVADGAGSTVFEKITSDSIDSTSIFNTNKFLLSFTFTDVSTARTMYIPIPYGCTVVKAWSALDATIATADCVFTLSNNAGGSMGTITIGYSGSAAGDVDSLSPSTNNTFTAGQKMSIASNGASSNTVNAQIVLELTQTA